MSKINPMSAERKTELKRNIIKELKGLIGPTIILAIILVFFWIIMNYQEKSEVDDPIQPRAYGGENTAITIQNDDLKLVMDPATTNFDITVKSSGKVWHSVPEGGGDDAKAVAEEKNRLQSSFLLTYGVDTGLTTVLDSYSYSATNGIFELETGEDYIKVDYSLGKVAKEFVIPPIIPEGRFNELTGMMDVNDSANVKQFYKKVDINNLKKSDSKEELLESYPILETDICYILRSGLKESAKKSIQQCFEKVGYTYEEYTEHKLLDQSESVNENPVFNATVIYRLDGKDLVVEVPFAGFESQKKYPISQINILPYFGAADASTDGFILVPEGGGSIINFNNGKLSQAAYYSNLYGWDMALKRDAVVHNTMASMNVYGMSTGNDSFICIMEDGGSYASIQADIAGKTNGYNYVNALYSIKPREKYDMGSTVNNDTYVFLETLPEEESIVKRYSFVDSGSYVDMAKSYRDYLVEKYAGVYTKNDDTSVPVALEVVGAVDKVKQIVGVPVSRPLALTTYDEAAELVTDVKNRGISNLSVKYTGWCNGGVKQQVLNKIKTISALGSKKDLQNFSDIARNLGVDVYLDGITDYAYDSNLLDGFFSYTDAAKFLSKTRAELYVYSDVTFSAREGLDSYFLLHGEEAIKMADNLVNTAAGYGTGVSFNNVGKDLSSDFYVKNYTSRDKAMNMQTDMLSSTKAAGQKIMINAGNAYAVPYADFITNMDLRGSEYTIIDEVVPFYQMALHGFVNYSGFPINTSGNAEKAILVAAEYGAGLSFSIMKESPFTLQKTLYTEYYASDYDAWGDEMMEIYDRYNKELGHTFNQTIEDHDNLSEDVSLTVYADGTKVYVNYGYADYSVDGITVPARDYKVVK